MLKEEKGGVPPQEKVEIKGISFPSGKADNLGVVFYFINVDGSFNNSWSVAKRYSQFEELHSALLLSDLAKKIPPGCNLPPKRLKLLTSHVTPAFIEQRRVLLEAYLKRLLKVEDIANSSLVTKFLSSDVQKEKEPEVKKKTDLPDDVEVTSITIPATRQMSDHVLYQIDVTNARKDAPFDKWTVLKRFGQFYDMDCAVRAAFLDKLDLLQKLPEPPERKAKIFNDHMDDTFVEHRRVLLQNYLSNMLSVIEVVRNKDFLVFLGVDA